MQNERNGIDIEPLLQREAVRTPFWRNYVLLFVLIIVAVTFLTLTRWEKYRRLVKEEEALVGITIDDWFVTTVRGRGIIAKQLVRDNVLLGKTKSEIVTMLGMPTAEHGNRMFYFVENHPKMWMVSCHLVIRCNAQTEIVEDASIKCDD